MDNQNHPEAASDVKDEEVTTTTEQSSEPVAASAPPKRAALIAGEDVRAIIPRSIEEAFRLAQVFITAGIVPDSYNYGKNPPEGCGQYDPDPAKVVIGILKSLEVGLPPITGISTIAVINNRPSIWGDGAQALIQQSGLLSSYEERWFGDSFDTEDSKALPLSSWPKTYGCEAKMWRVGQDMPFIGRFTVGDADRANLWNNVRKKPWMESPKRMLKIRARAFAQRDGFADALAGLSVAEEIRDHLEERTRVVSSNFLSASRPEPVAIEHQPNLDVQIDETAEKVFADPDATAARIAEREMAS